MTLTPGTDCILQVYVLMLSSEGTSMGTKNVARTRCLHDTGNYRRRHVEWDEVVDVQLQVSFVVVAQLA